MLSVKCLAISRSSLFKTQMEGILPYTKETKFEVKAVSTMAAEMLTMIVMRAGGIRSKMLAKKVRVIGNRLPIRGFKRVKMH